MGIFKLNGIDYMGGGGGGNTNYEELTQLEYDALTEEEKNNGTIYFIKDTNSNQDDKFQPTIYSENEREIGVWTDGKPLYQKTTFVTPGNTISMVGLSLKHGQCYSINTSGGIASVPYNDGLYTVWWMSNDAIRFATQRNNDISQYVITYQYTKDSDSPGSGQWTPQGVPTVHYSTEEQIVGTWVDGSTMYEKTYVGTIGNYDSSIDGYLISTDIDVTTIKELINIDGSLKSTDSSPAFASLNGLKNTSPWSADIHINRYGILLWTGTSSYGSKFAGGKAVVTIRYTKQTS